MNLKNPYSLFEKSYNNFPDKLAVIYKDRKFTYRELSILVNNTKSFFIKSTEVQDIICLYLENSDYWLAAYFGILGAGCICCPFDHRISSENMIKKIKFTKPKYLVTSEKYLEKVKREGIDKLTTIIVVDDLIKEGYIGTRGLENAKYSTILFTSGTTDNQKAIRLPSEVVYDATTNIMDYLKIRYDDIYYAILPFSHSFGIGNVHTIFKAGGSVVIADNTINLKKILDEIVEFKATFLAATPLTLKTMVDFFFKELIFAGENLRVICTNTGPMNPIISQKIIDNLKKTYFYTYYGLTEASRSTFYSFNLYPEKIESVGKQSPNVQVKVLDSHHNEVMPLEIGEIFVTGNNVISEYWNDEDKTKKVFINGGMLTGDIGYYDNDGFLYILGRKDDLVNIGGEKFSLVEIDKIIKELDFIEDAATIIKEDAAEGHIVAFVVLKQGWGKEQNLPRERMITEHCKRKMENYKIPREIIFVDVLPKTESGKLRRKEIR